MNLEMMVTIFATNIAESLARWFRKGQHKRGPLLALRHRTSTLILPGSIWVRATDILPFPYCIDLVYHWDSLTGNQKDPGRRRT